MSRENHTAANSDARKRLTPDHDAPADWANIIRTYKRRLESDWLREKQNAAKAYVDHRPLDAKYHDGLADAYGQMCDDLADLLADES